MLLGAFHSSTERSICSGHQPELHICSWDSHGLPRSCICQAKLPQWKRFCSAVTSPGAVPVFFKPYCGHGVTSAVFNGHLHFADNQLVEKDVSESGSLQGNAVVGAAEAL